MPDFVISTAKQDDWPALCRMIAYSFLEEPDEAIEEAEGHNFEPERTLLARRDDELIGSAAALTRRMAVPGGTVACGHVTQVAVVAHARRQGVLTALKKTQLADIRAAGEPVAALWASEGRIYQRFGYGLAARRMSVNIDAREVTLTAPADPSVRVRPAVPLEVRDELARVYDAAWPDRPGWSQRHESTWSYRLADPPSRLEGASPRRAVLAEQGGEVIGYALYRTKGDWDANGPNGTVDIIEVVAPSPGAYAALWRFLIGYDLTRTTSWWLAAIDEPLLRLVNEPRRLGARVGDSLWIRIVDLPAALAARRYAAPVDLVLDVTDELIPENAGRWRLAGGPDGATCEATTDAADLSLDVKALGSAYLGDGSLGPLAQAGLVVEERPGAVARASAGFGWHRAPHGIEVF
ncbi:GNAT family N-acetyltransferase [Luedemannella helvata]|uniref:GNAT family N-acetyltransferase n=1 Tax=Luedemannella helvata TaxID=349315 RepID=A0ABP4X795_9ACTN